jgi:hypothetical protein
MRTLPTAVINPASLACRAVAVLAKARQSPVAQPALKSHRSALRAPRLQATPPVTRAASNGAPTNRAVADAGVARRSPVGRNPNQRTISEPSRTSPKGHKRKSMSAVRAGYLSASMRVGMLGTGFACFDSTRSMQTLAAAPRPEVQSTHPQCSGLYAIPEALQPTTQPILRQRWS